MRLPAKVKGLLGGSLPLLVLRLLQLARPFLLILVLRFTNKDIAAQYAALLGIYVITLEIYNILAPTDRLYFSESTRADLHIVLRRRAMFAPVLMAGTWAALRVWGHLSGFEAALLALAGFANSLAIAVTSALYGRARMGKLAQAEGVSWLTQIASLAAFLSGWPIVIGFLIYTSEQVFRALVLAHHAPTGALRAPAGEPPSPAVAERQHSMGAMMTEGVTATLTNHIHRLAFVVHPGVVDPIFLIGVQASSATYNVLIGMASRVRLRPHPLLGLAASLLVATGVLLASMIGVDSWRLVLQTGGICGLAVIHGLQMIFVPGRGGIAMAKWPRAVLLGGLALVIAGGVFISPASFLLSPAILAIAILCLERRTGAARNDAS